jgi:hypothetical protein
MRRQHCVKKQDGSRRTRFPRNDRKVIVVLWPRQSFLSLTKALELHCQLALADFIIGENLDNTCQVKGFASQKVETNLQMTGQTQLLAYPDEPLGGVILVPFNGVAIVHRELVMEVVVPFTNGDERGDKVVTRGVLIVEGSVAEPVREGVYTES